MLSSLRNPSEVSPHVNKMEFAHCVYLLAVYQLETMRVQHAQDAHAAQQVRSEPAVSLRRVFALQVFQYVASKAVAKDEPMQTCVAVIARRTYEAYLDACQQRPHDDALAAELDEQVGIFY